MGGSKKVHVCKSDLLNSDIRCFFSFPNNPKDLDLSYKTDLHFFFSDCHRVASEYG